jgi:hypothetical protein
LRVLPSFGIANLRRTASFIDVIGIPIYIGWFIWRGQFTAPRLWIGFPIWLVGELSDSWRHA